jgi:transcription antitermination factor NusG
VTDWALLTTRLNSEQSACEDLSRLSFPFYCFKRPYTRVYRGRVIDRMVPAFPRYLFVPFPSAWDIMHRVQRITGVVKHGDNVARVPRRIIDSLVERCAGGDVLPMIEVPSRFNHGDRVVVNGAGPMAGNQAVYQSEVFPGKVRLLFDWMGRYVPIDIDDADVELFVEEKREHRTRKRKRRRKRHLQLST